MKVFTITFYSASSRNGNNNTQYGYKYAHIGYLAYLAKLCYAGLKAINPTSPLDNTHIGHYNTQYGS